MEHISLSFCSADCRILDDLKAAYLFMHFAYLASGINATSITYGDAGSLCPILSRLVDEILRVVRIGRGDDRHLIDDLQIEAVVDEGIDLFGIVRQQPHLARGRGP